MNRAERRRQERQTHGRNELTAEVKARAAALGGRAEDMRDYCFVLLVDHEGGASVPVFRVPPEQAVEWLRTMADLIEANPTGPPSRD